MKNFLPFASRFFLMSILISIWGFSGCSAGMYKPGNIEGTVSQAIKQTPDNDFWEMENNIDLFRFEQNNITEKQGIPIVVIHGGPGIPPESPWEGMEDIAQTHPVYYYHQRGCGLSTRPIERFESKNFYKNALELEEKAGITAQIKDIEHIRQILQSEKIILVGHSFGGFLAALYAAEFPENVEKLILVEPANVIVLPQKKGPDLFTVVSENLKDQKTAEEYKEFLSDYMNFGKLFENNEESLRNKNITLGRYYSLIYPDKTQLGDFPKEDWVGGWMVQALYMSMGKKHDYRKFLTRINADSLLIQGKNDFLKMPDKNPYTESISSLKVIELDTGHHPGREKPNSFSKVITEFIDG